MNISTLTLLWKSFPILWNKKSRWILILIPFILGVAFYSTFFYSLFDWIMNTGHPFLVQYFGIQNWGNFIKWFFLGFTTILSLFLVNWSFVIVINLFSAPFNDYISSSIETQYAKIRPPETKMNLSYFIKLILNESKKLVFIAFLSITAFVLSFIPLLLPLTIWISFILIGIQYSDYYWARHDYSAGKCIKEIFRNIIPFTLAGAFFFFLINIPFLNLFVPAWGTSYFTYFFTQKKNLA